MTCTQIIANNKNTIPIVNTIPSDSHNGPLPLTTFDNDELLLRRCACKDNLRMVEEDLIELCRSHIAQICSMNDCCLCLTRIHCVDGNASFGGEVFHRQVAWTYYAHTLRDRFRSDRMVACDKQYKGIQCDDAAIVFLEIVWNFFLS